VVRNAAPIGRQRLVRADVDAAINGRRVAGDDLAVERLRQADAERTLAGRRRTDDGNQSAIGQGRRSL
jgi:hypothetical protein